MMFFNRDAKAREKQAREDLFCLLDENMAKHVGRHNFWRTLHKLDAEIEPNAIHLEPFRAGSARGVDGDVRSEEMFCKGTPTVVVQLKSKAAAIDGARTLNKVFAGSGTEFVAEAVHYDGRDHFQIRSNIDKQHWDKLCVFMHYRFEREIPQEERKALQKECHTAVHHYTRGTVNAHWRTLEGVPAFITLMGLHGVLRPVEQVKPDVRRKQAEFNSPNARGTPYVFDGIKVHVELKSRNSGAVTMVPYSYGFEVDKSALEDATEGKSYWGLLLETFGGNPFQKEIGLASRAIYTIGLSIGLFGASKGAEELIGWIGPGASIGSAGAFIVATYVNHKWKILQQIEGIRKGSKELRALEEKYAQQEAVGRAFEYSEPEPEAPTRTAQTDMEAPYVPNNLVKHVEGLVKMTPTDRTRPPASPSGLNL
jgi:hypothetical protein